MIVVQAFCYGALTSTQYTSMNTLVYADVPDANASNASSIASTFQQLSVSFGVAAAGLTTVFSCPGNCAGTPAPSPWACTRRSWRWRLHDPLDDRLRQAQADDGANETRQKDIHAG